MTMTYAELAELIGNMTEEQKQHAVTVHVSGVDEYYPLLGDYPVVKAAGTDVLDEGHHYLRI